uniref:PC-esterase domain containing 1B n=1 Tax=Canis lupus familiaris TaxID=9615 RepID=A0A8C0Z2M5_CANLF
MNSCLWDLSRYGPDSWRSYRENLASLFRRLGQVLPESCLLVWNTAMPVGKQITAGFLPPDHQPGDGSLIERVIEANFYSSAEAKRHGFDVLDLHFHFRHAGQHLQRDGVHWDERAHRHLSQLLLAHLADAWGVELPRRDHVSTCVRARPGFPVRGRAPPRARSHSPCLDFFLVFAVADNCREGQAVSHPGLLTTPLFPYSLGGDQALFPPPHSLSSFVFL